MVVSTSLEADGERAVVVKRSDVAEPLQAEADRLQRAAHPGVVPLVGSGPVGAGWELRIAHCGRPVGTAGRLPVAQVASLAAGLAATLADLHDLGVVHGRVDASHVLVGPEGRPVLCGLGPGVPAACPHDDVAAVGALLVELLGPDDGGEPIPDRRWRRRRGWAGWDRPSLLLLADQAAAEPPSRRPTARRLAAAIAEVAPAGAPVGERPGPEAPAASGPEIDAIESVRASALVDRARPTVRPPAALVVGAVVLVLAAGAARVLGEAPQEAAPERRTATPVADAVVRHGGVRYRVGEPGDHLLVEDWDCDGLATPALLRPATGEVFVFPRWIERGVSVIGPVAAVDRAEALVSDGGRDDCPALAVRTRDGALVPIPEAAR